MDRMRLSAVKISCTVLHNIRVTVCLYLCFENCCNCSTVCTGGMWEVFKPEVSTSVWKQQAVSCLSFLSPEAWAAEVSQPGQKWLWCWKYKEQFHYGQRLARGMSVCSFKGTKHSTAALHLHIVRVSLVLCINLRQVPVSSLKVHQVLAVHHM
jgi:hypothetical protein